MTRGEKIAWIWVWSAMAVVALGLATAAWRYAGLPKAYVDSLICTDGKENDAGRACRRVLASTMSTLDMRTGAYLRLATLAKEAGRYDEVLGHLDALIATGQATALDWNERGVARYTLGRFKDAADDFRAAIGMDDKIGIFWANLADARLEMKDYAEAERNYGAALALGADTAEILGNRGWARYQLGSFEEALKDFDAALAKDPKHFDNLNERGLVHHALGDYPAALADFDQSIELSSKNAVILTNRSASLSRLGQWEKAQADLDLAISLDPKYVPARLEKAWFFIDQRQPANALSELGAFVAPTNFDIQIFEARAQAHANLNEWQSVIANADQAVAAGSRAPWLYQIRADARYELGDQQGAIADATLALAGQPTNSNALVTRAFALLVSDRPETAIADIELLVQTASDRAYALEVRSYFHLTWGRLEAALADARQSAALAPTSPDSAVALGRMLAERGDGAAALAQCNRALGLAETALTWRCRALAYLILGQHGPAAADIKRSLALNNASSNSQIAMGRIELAQGNARGAIERFNEALSLETYDSSGVFMFRGDAARALGNLDQARLDYLEAKKRDLGRYRSELAERLTALPAQ